MRKLNCTRLHGEEEEVVRSVVVKSTYSPHCMVNILDILIEGIPARFSCDSSMISILLNNMSKNVPN